MHAFCLGGVRGFVYEICTQINIFDILCEILHVNLLSKPRQKLFIDILESCFTWLGFTLIVLL